MKVGLNTQTITSPAFRAANEAKNNAATTATIEQTQLITQESPKRKFSLRMGLANLWKSATVANQMANATAKGLFYGAGTGVFLLAGYWLFKPLPKALTKEGPTLKETILHPLKHIGKSGKIIAGVGAGIVLAYNIIIGRLEANQKTAVIDHKLKIGHRDK
jgi:hypothetical protein